MYTGYVMEGSWKGKEAEEILTDNFFSKDHWTGKEMEWFLYPHNGVSFLTFERESGGDGVGTIWSCHTKNRNRF